MTMRSLLARVKTLLSSMTEFMDSIQLASKSPSNTIHLGLVSFSLPSSFSYYEKMPCFHEPPEF